MNRDTRLASRTASCKKFEGLARNVQRYATKASPPHRCWLVGLLAIGLLFGSRPSQAGELKQETLNRWNEYIQAANSQMRCRLSSSGTFLWVDEDPERDRQVRAGKILVSPAGPYIPMSVPSGLIHDWIGAAYFPNTKLQDVLTVARGYDHYHEYYKPSVVGSRSLASSGDEDQFSILLANKELIAMIALDTEYEARYQQVDENRWYAVSYSTRIQEIRHYGHAEETKLPPDQGSGYVWRLYTITRFEERNGGVYVEVEAFALSRDIPSVLRWVVNPIVRRVSRNSLQTSLRQMQEAVRSTIADRDPQSSASGRKKPS